MKLRLMVILLFLAGSSLEIFSQSTLWYLTRGFSGRVEEAWGVDADSAGNIYWTTEQKDVWSYWYFNIILYKIDSNAQQVWQSPSWGNGTGFNDIAFIAKANRQKIYLAGRLDSTAALNGSGGNALVLSCNTNNGSFCFRWMPRFSFEDFKCRT